MNYILLFLILFFITINVLFIGNKKFVYQLAIFNFIILSIIVFLLYNKKNKEQKVKPGKYPMQWDPVMKSIFRQRNDEENLELFLRQTAPILPNPNQTIMNNTAEKAIQQLTQYNDLY